MRIGTMLRDVAWALFQRPATQRYPLEHTPAPERLRSALCWNPARCTGCEMCTRDCPAQAIELIILDKAQKRFVLRYHVDRCTFCAQCVHTCNFGCLELANDTWELAALHKQALVRYYGDDSDVAIALANSPGGQTAPAAAT